MSHQKTKVRKKKAKERATKAQLRYKRDIKAKEKKRERDIDADVKANRDKITPYVSPEKEKLRKQQQLENNLQLLKALEEEYKKEQTARKELNDRLEAQGAHTLKEKIDVLGKEANKQAEEAEETLLEKTNKVLTQVRSKEILQGQLEQEEWQSRRKIFRENVNSTKVTE